jgi:hypothetical protein
MKSNVAAMKTECTYFQLQNLRADYTGCFCTIFERVGIAKTEWLPFTMLAYTQMINGTTLQDAAQKKDLFMIVL